MQKNATYLYLAVDGSMRVVLAKVGLLSLPLAAESHDVCMLLN